MMWLVERRVSCKLRCEVKAKTSEDVEAGNW